MPFHVHWRRVIPFLILVVAAVSVYAYASLNILRQEETARWENHYLALAQLIAAEAEPFFLGVNQAESLDQIAEKYHQQLNLSLVFFNPEGAILGAAPATAPENLALNVNEPISGVISNDQDGITVAAVIPDGAQNPVGFLLLNAPRENFAEGLGSVWQVWAGVVLVALVSGVVLSVVLHDYLLRPVEKLTIASQQMSLGNFHNLEFPDSPQELSDLSLALKDMAEHLGDQIDALTTERAKLSAVLNQMTDGVLIADREGRVQLLNPAAERLFQIDYQKGLGRSVVEVLRYHQMVDLWRAAKEGQRETTMLEIGPQHLFLQVTGMPLKTSERGSTLILIQDLTQLRRLETVRRDFISNVSHELRTPLASLKALGETLQESALEDPPAARRFILRMETEIDNLTQLVNELLELSRIESGKLPLSFHRIQPCDLLKTAYERMELQVERAGLNLVLDCQPELPAVFADPDRIAQVVINLIHNATKFTPPGGQISLSAYQDGDFIVFYVKDTGVGIPKEDLARIFERFYKADRARSGGGTGLGLSIARHMVESHGGYIWAESEEELGSTLNFSLPIA